MSSASDGSPGLSQPEQPAQLKISAEVMVETSGADGSDTTSQQSRRKHDRAAFVRNAGHIIWRTQPDGTWWDGNPQWRDFTGQKPGSEDGWGWLDAVHPDDREGLRARWIEAIQASPPGTYSSEFRLRRYDGVYRHMLSRAIPVIENGELREWIGFSIDITEQRQSEIERAEILAREHAARADAEAMAHKLAQRASALEAILVSSVDSITLFDVNGHIIFSNPKARELIGLDADPSLADMSLEERAAKRPIVDTNGSLIPMNEWPQMRVLRGEVLTGESVCDVVIRDLDGREHCMNISGAPIRDSDGTITGAVLIGRDITERQQLEHRTHEAISALLDVAQALVEPAGTMPPAAEEMRDVHETARRLAELTRSILGAARVAIASVDPQTEVMRPLAISGFSPDETAHWWNSWQGRPTLEKRFGHEGAFSLRVGEVIELASGNPTHSQRLAPYGSASMLLAPMIVGDQLIGTIALDFAGRTHYSSQDLTFASAIGKVVGLVIERERLLKEWAEAQASELALRQANKRMDDFLGIASHELRTPLTTIKANIQMIQRWRRRNPAGDPQQEMLLVDRTGRQVDRLTRLVDDLVDVSRIHVGPLDLRRSECDLVAIVRDVTEEQRLANPERKITCECEVEPLFVHADGDRIGQVVTNYLTNALKYSQIEQPVHVTLTKENRNARLAVRDFGPGFGAEVREHVWDLFYRAPGVEVQSGSGVGLGLGLHISKTIIERHGGSVGVESVPGKGSTFWFTLPLA